jgi:molybdopterin/thiamine biosynthesis adenylyltransferase
MEEVGEEGQEKLLKSKVLVIGAGGLGSPVLMYLAAAGVWSSFTATKRRTRIVARRARR